jgi:hypothetical protein
MDFRVTSRPKVLADCSRVRQLEGRLASLQSRLTWLLGIGPNWAGALCGADARLSRCQVRLVAPLAKLLKYVLVGSRVAQPCLTLFMLQSP